MDIAGAVFAMVFALLMLVVLLLGCVMGAVALVRIFRHQGRAGDETSSAAVVREAGSASQPPVHPRPVPSGQSVLADAERTATWRYRQLLELGLDPVSAAELATSSVDLGSMRRLVDRGCPAPLAGRILR